MRGKGGMKKHRDIKTNCINIRKIRSKFVGRHQVELVILGYRLEVTVLFGVFTLLHISIT